MPTVEVEHLRALFAEGRRAWPLLQLGEAAFARRIARALGESRAAAPSALALRAGDLFLACACAEGVAGAVQALEERYASILSRAIARVDRSPQFADEVLQELRHRLFTPRAGGPGIDSYSGEGPLDAWLRTSALRTALNARTRKPRAAAAGDDELVALAGDRPDPELALLKARHGQDFERALRDSLALLEPRDRLLLRLHYTDGLSTRRIAQLQGRHQSNVARAIAAARDELRSGARRLLAERLGLTPAQIDSLAGLVISRLDLTLASLETDAVR